MRSTNDPNEWVSAELQWNEMLLLFGGKCIHIHCYNDVLKARSSILNCTLWSLFINFLVGFVLNTSRGGQVAWRHSSHEVLFYGFFANLIFNFSLGLVCGTLVVIFTYITDLILTVLTKFKSIITHRNKTNTGLRYPFDCFAINVFGWFICRKLKQPLGGRLPSCT